MTRYGQVRMITRATRRARQLVVEPLREFLHAEAAGGLILLAAALLALVWANLPGTADSYVRFWSTDREVSLGAVEIVKDLRHWVNDGLMTLFFFVVGLEIKRELVTGELKDPRVAALPALAAVGGVLLPAAIFLAIAPEQPLAAGWGIPVATDIAFGIGVLAVLGSRAPNGAKLFLLSVAIVDDLIAITIIAVFYSETISAVWLAAAGLGLLIVAGMRLSGTRAIWWYAVVGTAIWFATLQSGVHPTIAGVALGLMTPARTYRGRDVLGRLEHRLHPVSAYLVVPLFALANAGVALSGQSLRDASGSRLAWAIIAGLVLGKTFGIAGVTLAVNRTGFARLPADLPAGAVWGVAALAGIGFTVSLFIADLAFDSPGLVDQAKVAILTGSLVSGLLGSGFLLLRRRLARAAPPTP